MQHLELKKITAEKIRVFNRIYSRSGSITFSMGETAYSIVFLPDKKGFTPKAVLTVETGGHAFSLEMEDLFFPELMDDFLAGEPLSAVPDPVRTAVVEAVLENLLNRFDAWCGSESAVRDITFSVPEGDPEPGIFFKLVRENGSARLIGRVSSSQAGMEWIADRLASYPPAVTETWDQLSFRAACEIGETLLSVEEIRDIDPGDIILLDAYTWIAEGTIRVRLSHGLCFAATLYENTVTLNAVTEDYMTDEETREESPEETEYGDPGGSPADREETAADENDAPEETSPLSLDALPVKLVFEVGEKRLTLGDIKALQPGITFELERNVEKPVAIRANGKIIGAGRLVQVDDRVGVEVMEFFDHDKR